MPCLADILDVKGSKIHTVMPDATVLYAIKRMNQHKVGAVVVMYDSRVVGMFTERDVLRRVMEEMRPLSTVTVGEVMTSDVICCPPEMDVDDASRIMMDHKIRHLPVCNSDGELKGLISIGDLNAFHATTCEQKISNLTDYIYGRG